MDTSLWLHNKLGTSNDSWTSGSICSQLNKDVLKNIKECFPDLQTQVKLKLLLSFFHIPRRLVEEWKKELEEIIEVAGIDSELWVSMIAETMKTFPATGSLNTEISDYDETRPIFTDMVNDLRRLVNKHSDRINMLPLECQYLNKSAFISVVGQQSQPVKHFTLKRKPKSIQLRTELLQKSSDAQSTLKKSSAPTIPLRSRGMPRKMTDTTPLKGIPSRVPVSGFRSPTSGSSINRPNPSRTPAGRKEGGVKLLDINEQPLGIPAKRRKKLEQEEQQKKAAEAAASAVPASTTPTPNATTSAASLNSTVTPDYAAGLTATAIYTQPATPAPAPATTSKATLDNGINSFGKNNKQQLNTSVSSMDEDMVNANDLPDEDDGMDVDGDMSPPGSPVPEEKPSSVMATSAATASVIAQPTKIIFTTQPQVVNSNVQQAPAQATTVKIINHAGQAGETIKLQQVAQPQQLIAAQQHQQQQQQQQMAQPKQQLIIKTLDPSQRLSYNQLISQGGTIISPTTPLTMPPGLTVLSSAAAVASGSGTTTTGGLGQEMVIANQQQTQQPKIVQIKTPTYMVASGNMGGATVNTTMPSLITAQGQYISLPQQTQQLQQQQQKKTVYVTSSSTGNVGGSTFTLVPANAAQSQQQPQTIQLSGQTAQIITNAAGQRFIMATPQKVIGQTTVQTIGGQQQLQQQAQQVAGGNKTIIVSSNQNLAAGQKGVIIKSIGPGGAPVYQQIPLSNMTRVQNIGGATILGQGQGTVIAKKPDVPALVPTGAATGGNIQTVMLQQQSQQQMPTLITNVAQLQPQQQQQKTAIQHPQGTTIIRPVLASNMSNLNVLNQQGYTLIQRPGQPPMLQAIQTTQQPQQQQPQLQQMQQVQRTIITTQQPQQQQQQQTIAVQQVQQQKRQIVTQQQQQLPVRKGLTLAPEHANKVTEMFRCANKVTRLDKALILSFIAGQTENPRPNPENVVTITLNQSKEKVRQEDNTEALMLVESVIRLDYNTMEYKTFQKYHRLEQVAQETNNNSNATNNNNNNNSNNGSTKASVVGGGSGNVMVAKAAIKMGGGNTAVTLKGSRAADKNVL